MAVWVHAGQDVNANVVKELSDAVLAAVAVG
jgi:hypothetical protein